MAKAFLIGLPEQSSVEAKLARALAFYGLECVAVRGRTLGEVGEELTRLADSEAAVCALACGDSLGELLCREADPASIWGRFAPGLSHLFVFGFQRADRSESALSAICNERLKAGDLGGGEQTEFKVSVDHPDVTLELTGHSFRAPKHASDRVFAAPLAGIGSLLTADGHPFFCSFRHNGCEVFLSASTEVIDVDAPAGDNFSFAEQFSRLMPLLIFLKRAFGDQMWQWPNHSMANLIIDDPLIRPTYGFVNFEALVRKADELNFTATLAFIPWNHRRSESSTIELFRKRSDRLSVCVHGCDHISAEFGITDLGRLNSTIQTALSRMSDHQQRTGLPFLKGMVFPQGHFSSASMLALKSNSFIAAINTEAAPMAGSGEEQLTVADFLDVAVTRYHGFALFRRRYPKDSEEFPFQLFAGKPLFLVEHHGFFKNGFDQLSEMVKKINAINPRVRWTNASEILTKSYKLRRMASDTVECRVFSSSQVIENRADNEQTFIVSKYEPQLDLLKQVTVNGAVTEFESRGETVQIAVPLKSTGTAQVSYEYANVLPSPQRKFSAKQRMRIGARRYLSEFRDNVIARNERLLAAATLIKDRLPK